MTLLPKQQLVGIPALYQTEGVPLLDKVTHLKFYHPGLGWTWYVIEYDGQDTCFGVVKGYETEFGYFSIKELSSLVLTPVERDTTFKPTPLRDLQSEVLMGVAA